MFAEKTISPCRRIILPDNCRMEIESIDAEHSLLIDIMNESVS